MRTASARQEWVAWQLRLAFSGYLMSVILLAWMKSPLVVAGYDLFPVDLAFLATACLLLVALASGQARLRLHPGFALLGLYFAALAVSAIQSDDPRQSAIKLVSQAYLLALPVITYNIVRTENDLRRVFWWWIAAALAVAALGTSTLLMFPLLGPNSVLDGPLHHFGTLPPGSYPRLELTFLYSSMLANYLGVSLMLVLISARLGWLGRRPAAVAGGSMLLVAFFALTPGFGGVIFMVALWFWMLTRNSKPRLAAALLAAGIAMALLSVATASISLIAHPDAPFLIHVPGLAEPLAPGIRLLLWIEALHSFVASPLFGHGIGTTWVQVAYAAGGCGDGCTMDAHNMFLNISIQSGIIGLAVVVAIIWFITRRLRAGPQPSHGNLLAFGLALAWVSGFAVEGLVGSFQDSRHLWVLFGLVLSADSLRASRSSTGDGAPRLR